MSNASSYDVTFMNSSFLVGINTNRTCWGLNERYW